MKVLWLFILAGWLTSPVLAQKKEPEKLLWLEGRWNRIDVQGDAQAFEEWDFHDEKLTGIGVMLSEKDTVFVERLSILRKKGNLYYLTEVARNAEPSNFKVTDVGNDYFISENEGHDFPKKIAYQLNGDLLTVTLSGNARSRKFVFRKED